MKLLSIQVGLPREVRWQRRTVSTGIFKEPVQGPVLLRTLNLDGDRQADLSVHGGRQKAVYVYPVEHYAPWRAELPGVELAWGAFGENFTTEGLVEDEVHIGDRFRIGEAEVEVTQPRMPCYKLGVRFGDPGLVERFLESRRSGFYLAVLREGHVEAGDPIEPLAIDPHQVTVTDINRLFFGERGEQDADTLARALQVEALPDGWKAHLRRQLV
ncbi:MAG TPA: MOSC domain-containing protein [Thermoanaerobaculia bacterium]|jgi:MOSC domain-containing protein YiiM|nr:MOSC domain-containing protein [Thermoanaerobaculia bacterium]